MAITYVQQKCNGKDSVVIWDSPTIDQKCKQSSVVV